MGTAASPRQITVINLLIILKREWSDESLVQEFPLENHWLRSQEFEIKEQKL